MNYAPIPTNEEARICAVMGLKILDTEAEERFDKITRKATETFNVPISTISILDRDREWYKSAQGIESSEGPRNISFCGHALLQQEMLIIEDAKENTTFADNPYVINHPGIRFYAGKSLYKDADLSLPVGVFCIKDYKPKKMTLEEVDQFLQLAAEAEMELNNIPL